MKVHPNRADRPMLADHVKITPWVDRTIDELGHDVLDRDTPPGHPPYVETFWLPVIGPTATFLLRRCVQQLEAAPRHPLPTELLSTCLGLGANIGRNSKLADTIDRCERFQFVHLSMAGDELRVRTHLPPMPAQTLRRLPEPLQALHTALYTVTPDPRRTTKPPAARLSHALLTPPAPVPAVGRALST